MRFFIGLPKFEEELRELEEESLMHKDIIILGHIDSYTNITMKSIGVFAWGAEACGAFYTVKTDDDSFIFLPRLLSNLYKTIPTNIYAGTSSESEIYRPIRDKNHQWYMPLREYPFRRGPGYMRGCLVVMSWDLAFYVGQVRHVPNFHWLAFEDTTLGYIVAARRPTMLQLPLTVSPDECRDDAVAVHYVSEEKLPLLLSNAMAGRRLCHGYP